MPELVLNPGSVEDYRLFLKVKSLPRYRIAGRVAHVPQEYLAELGLPGMAPPSVAYEPSPFLYDYQAACAAMGVRKERFAFFAKCGIGKTFVLSECVRTALTTLGAGDCFLIVSPLMVIGQTVEEIRKFYGDRLPVEHVRPAKLQDWLERRTGRVGITNYEGIRKGLRKGRLKGLAIDESSTLKSHYGQWGRRLIGLARGLRWVWAFTGTPAPNDRIEYANHAVLLGRFPTVNSFLARYFVNKGKTGNRWELKPHALRQFYRSLSDWCIFLEDPATYGWKDNLHAIPAVNVTIHDVPLTEEQVALVVSLGGGLDGSPGGITKRGRLAQLAKGLHDGRSVSTNKPGFIRELIASWPGRSTIVWCHHNHEQEHLARMMPHAANISGETPYARRCELIEKFKSGEIKDLITKPRLLQFGLNLQIATRHVFNGTNDSSEEWLQAIARSNRIGSTEELEVHVPVTPVERHMLDNVLRKLRRIRQDSQEQERLFKEVRVAC